jgi:hypothetical protein
MTPDPAPVIALSDAFRASTAMFAAVALEVFDMLAEGPHEAVALARRTGADEGAVERLLDACAALGLLAGQGGAYANLPVADVYLRRSIPRTLAGYVLYSDRVLFPMWAHLEDAVREDAPRWKRTFGVAGGIFNGFFKTGADARESLEGMHGFGLLSPPAGGGRLRPFRLPAPGGPGQRHRAPCVGRLRAVAATARHGVRPAASGRAGARTQRGGVRGTARPRGVCGDGLAQDRGAPRRAARAAGLSAGLARHPHGTLVLISEQNDCKLLYLRDNRVSLFTHVEQVCSDSRTRRLAPACRQ